MSLSFDGFDLTRYALVQIERQPGPSMRVETEQIPGRSGDLVLSCEMDPIVIVAHCTLRRKYVSQWKRIRTELASIFTARTQRVLHLPEEPEYHRYALASFTSNVREPLVPPVTFDVTFTCHDPVAYGNERSATVPSGGTVYVDVGGTAPAVVRVSASSAVRDSSSLVWGVRFDDAAHLHVPISSSSARAVEIDCHDRVVTVAGALSMVTLDSEWVELSPGAHKVAMDKGTGAAKITWTERYL